jgi:MYXO-CTERM domain-containing protein
LAIALCGLAIAPAASADPGNPNFESLVQSVTPNVKGLTVAMLNGDDRLEVDNRSGKTITISGYQGEPFVKMAANGVVSVNLHSPAYYLDQTRLGTNVPASANPKSKPLYTIVSKTGRYQFHDHRTHWMLPTTPPQVKDKSKRTVVDNWKVPVQIGGQAGAISGTLFWRGSTGGPPAAAFIGLALIALLGLGAVVVVRRRRAAADPDGGADGGPGTTGAAPKAEAW